MADQEFRTLLRSKGFGPDFFEINKDVLDRGAQHQLDTVRRSYSWGQPSVVAIYDQLPLEQVIFKLKSTMGDQFRYVDFSYAQTNGKKRVRSPLSKDVPTSGLLSHILFAEETDFNEPTLILYHSFDGIVAGVTKLVRGELFGDTDDPDYCQIRDITEYLDKACGRNWTEGNRENPRLLKLSGEKPLIRTAVVMSIDEKVANNWYHENHPSCTRSHIGRALSAVYIF